MTDREIIVAKLASVGVTLPPIPQAAEPRNLLLIGRGNGTFDHILGTDGRALQGNV